MAVKLVKCKYCGIQFDRLKEPTVEVSARRYAHKECADNYNNSLSQEEKDYMELEKYIKKLFNTNVVNAKIRKQIKDFKKEYNYSYTGIQKTLYWWYEIKKNDLSKANDGIGIVPFIYKDACDYFYRIYLAQQANAENAAKPIKIEIQEIEIGSPRVYINSPKFFKFSEEENNGK